MILTEEQLAEIRRYIFSAPRFRETYNELYDHILNALEETDKDFDIALVQQIVKDDFGGFEYIVAQESKYQQQVIRKYTRMLGAEMLNTFKFPAVLGNVCLIFLIIILYQTSLNYNFDIRPMYRGLYILVVIPLFFYGLKRFIADRKHIKLSIKYEFLHLAWTLAFFSCQLLSLLVFNANFFNISTHTQLMILCAAFFTASIYIRGFLKVYYKRINVLPV